MVYQHLLLNTAGEIIMKVVVAGDNYITRSRTIACCFFYWRGGGLANPVGEKIKVSNNNMMTTVWPAVLWQQQQFILCCPFSSFDHIIDYTSMSSFVIIRISQFLLSASVCNSREQEDPPPYKRNREMQLHWRAFSHRSHRQTRLLTATSFTLT